MDTATLVGSQIEDGYTLIRQLAHDNFDVGAACWIKTSEDDESFLYIASKLVDEKGLAEAYRDAYASLRRMGDSRISMSEVKLIGLANPIAKDMLEIRSRHSGTIPGRYRGQQLGGIAISEAFIYPASAASGGDFDILARGREEVLKHLEREAELRSGRVGEYVLARDGRGNLLAIIAGQSFIGSGTMVIGGNRFLVENGLVVSVQRSTEASGGEMRSEEGKATLTNETTATVAKPG